MDLEKPWIDENMFLDTCEFLSSKDLAQDSHGNISVLIEGQNAERSPVGAQTMLIKPSGLEYFELRKRGVCLVDFWKEDGEVKFKNFGTLKPSVDTIHHAEIYLNNPHVESICHTHSPYATAMAIMNWTLVPFCTEHADYFGREIRCLEFSSFDRWGRDVFLESTPVKERAILLAAHGALTFGFMGSKNASLDAAKNAVALEAIAQKYHIASGGFDQPVPLLDPAIVSAWHDRFRNGAYGQ